MFKMSLLFLAMSLFILISPATKSWALAPTPFPEGTPGQLTIEFVWKSRHESRGEFKDLTVLDRRTTIVCPVIASDIQSTSIISGATTEQQTANKQLEEVATTTLKSIPKETIDQMATLDKQMKACKKAGGSEQACGIQIMLAMQQNLIRQNPLEHSQEEKIAKAETAVKNAESQIQPWFNEGCTGQMTVNDSRKLDDPTIAGEEPTLHTTETQKIETTDTLITVETDLAKNTTQYMFVSPEASGFLQEASYGEEPKKVGAQAMPKSVVIVGPLPGTIQSGSYTYPIAEGEVHITWTFRKS